MRKIVKQMSVLAMVLGFSVLANAKAPRLDAETCELNGNVSGIGLSLIWGGQVISGSGTLECREADGTFIDAVPVHLTFLSGGLGLDFSIIRSMNVRSGRVFVANGPSDFLGSFSVGATAGVDLLNRSLNFDAAVRVTREPGVGIELALTGRDAIGFGARLHATTLIVTPVALR